MNDDVKRLETKFIEVSDHDGARDIEYLAREIWPTHYGPIIGADQVDYMLRTFQSTDAVLAQISDGYRYFLILADREFVGYFAVLSHKDKGELFLSKLYVRADQRGRGIGQQVLSFVENLARAENLSKISLSVNKNNAAAIQFYEHCGFDNDGPVVKDIGGGFVMDDYLFSKTVIDYWGNTVREKSLGNNVFADDPGKVFLALGVFFVIVIFFLLFFPKPRASQLSSEMMDVSQSPRQIQMVGGAPIYVKFVGAEFRIVPVAAYTISGVVLGKFFYWPYETWDRLSPYDVMIGWGELALPENAKYIDIEHGMRSHSFKLKPLAPYSEDFLNSHASFNHVIPANTNIFSAISSVSKGQAIQMSGYLVNVINQTIPGYQQWKTSTAHNDFGVGSCEVLYVTKVVAEGKVFQ